jgi:hypothetical protein
MQAPLLMVSVVHSFSALIAEKNGDMACRVRTARCVHHYRYDFHAAVQDRRDWATTRVINNSDDDCNVDFKNSGDN